MRPYPHHNYDPDEAKEERDRRSDLEHELHNLHQEEMNTLQVASHAMSGILAGLHGGNRQDDAIVCEAWALADLMMAEGHRRYLATLDKGKETEKVE